MSQSKEDELEKLKSENERLREWIRNEGVESDICTFNVLNEICDGCRCGRASGKQQLQQ